jgi:hypothetical protein
MGRSNRGDDEVIAEVHQIKGQGAAPPSGDGTNLAEEAARAPGSEQLLVLADTNAGEGLVIHLWSDEASYEAFAARRKEMISQSEGMGGHVDTGRIYEVMYRS